MTSMFFTMLRFNFKKLSIAGLFIFIILFFAYFRYNFAYIVFYLLGINTLIPWSFFITADDVSD